MSEIEKLVPVGQPRIVRQSSDTPETDAVNSGEWESLEIRYDLMHDLAEKLELERDYWKNKRTLKLESLMPLHHHEWSDGAKVKIPGKEWRIECCQCGVTRMKQGSLVILPNV